MRVPLPAPGRTCVSASSASLVGDCASSLEKVKASCSTSSSSARLAAMRENSAGTTSAAASSGAVASLATVPMKMTTCTATHQDRGWGGAGRRMSGIAAAAASPGHIPDPPAQTEPTSSSMSSSTAPGCKKLARKGSSWWRTSSDLQTRRMALYHQSGGHLSLARKPPSEHATSSPGLPRVPARCARSIPTAARGPT